jgi:hypothetical protein
VAGIASGAVFRRFYRGDTVGEREKDRLRAPSVALVVQALAEKAGPDPPEGWPRLGEGGSATMAFIMVIFHAGRASMPPVAGLTSPCACRRRRALRASPQDLKTRNQPWPPKPNAVGPRARCNGRSPPSA